MLSTPSGLVQTSGHEKRNQGGLSKERFEGQKKQKR